MSIMRGFGFFVGGVVFDFYDHFLKVEIFKIKITIKKKKTSSSSSGIYFRGRASLFYFRGWLCFNISRTFSISLFKDYEFVGSYFYDRRHLLIMTFYFAALSKRSRQPSYIKNKNRDNLFKNQPLKSSYNHPLSRKRKNQPLLYIKNPLKTLK